MTGITALALWWVLAPQTGVCTDTVEGRVVDEASGEPVAAALVRLGAATVETDSTGHFELRGVCPGDHALTVERPEYHTVRQQVAVDGDTEVDVHALPREVEHDDHVLVKVAATTATETRASQTLEGEALARTRGKGFAEALAGVPGIAVLRSSAGGLGKPIIRGQYGRRNLVLFDGVRHQGQEWGIDHAPEIDPFSAGSITVIKGAGSIRHGPDAMGGVVLVEPPALLHEPGVRGQAHLVGVSNGLVGSSALRLDGAHRRLPGFAWRAEANATRGAAPMTPLYALDNTGSLVWNAGGTLAYEGQAFDVRLSYRHHVQKAGICTCLTIDSPESFEQSLQRGTPVGSELYTSEYRIERPLQQVSHDLASARGRVLLGRAGELRAVYAFQDNQREEFAVVREGVEGPQLELRLRTHTADVAFEHAPLRLADGLWLEGVAGANLLQQNNAFDGNQTLIPDYTQGAGGLFVLERVETEPFEMQWGLRVDGMRRVATLTERDYLGQTQTGRLDPEGCEATASGGGRCPFAFGAVSGSYGVLARPVEGAELRLDLSSAARFPNADELLINGIAPSFPVLALGNASLGVERSWGSSLTVGTSGRWLSTETSVFANYIDDYIYFAPELVEGRPVVSETIRGPFLVFTFRPVDAVFYGGEHAFQIAPPRWPVSLDGQISVVRALDVQTPAYLAFVPPGSYRLHASYRWPELGRVRNGYVSVGGTFVDRQRRFDPIADFAPPPPAYFLLGAATGVELSLGDQVLSLALEGGNLTNARYRQYTSLLRYFADEPGWELRLRLSLDFSIEGPGRHDHDHHDHHHR